MVTKGPPTVTLMYAFSWTVRGLVEADQKREVPGRQVVVTATKPGAKFRDSLNVDSSAHNKNILLNQDQNQNQNQNADNQNQNHGSLNRTNNEYKDIGQIDNILNNLNKISPKQQNNMLKSQNDTTATNHDAIVSGGRVAKSDDEWQAYVDSTTNKFDVSHFPSPKNKNVYTKTRFRRPFGNVHAAN